MTEEAFAEEFGRSYQEYTLRAEAENRLPMAEGVWKLVARLFSITEIVASEQQRSQNRC